MEKLSTRIIIAIIVFIIFGWLAMVIGTFDWLDALKVGLLGVCAFFAVFSKNHN